jgi:hypothetical protein
VVAADAGAPAAVYVEEQARLLGLRSRLARSELHVVKAHQRVLELPGTGGQLAHHLLSAQRELTFKDNFIIACGTWQEATLAGAIGLEHGTASTEPVVLASAEDLKNPDHPIRKRTFELVVGLHPDKGGQLKVADQLAIWFPTAKHLLV